MPIGRPNLDWLKSNNWIAIPLFSIALLIPCCWQSRIQSADLSSHIYNAWLASQIDQGKAPGLWISSQSNNVLFDLMLEWLFVHVGPSLAQRIAVAISVLVFSWGAICFIFRAGGRNWWFAAPCVAMLAYGFIFHMGFFNFHLATGLCLCFLAIVWDSNTPPRVYLMGAPLLLLAWTAHPFPVVWTIGMVAYFAVANRISPPRRFLLLMFALAAVVATRLILTHRYLYNWSLQQIFFVTGANQIALFGLKYTVPFAGLLFVWLLRLRRMVKQIGMARLLITIPFQLWLLSAAAVLLIPNRIMFPEFALPFSYVTDRFSLLAGLVMCVVLAAAPDTRFTRIALASVTVLFFGLLYADNRELNRLEDRLDLAVARLPAAQRAITSLPSESLRSLCLQHDLDRACIDHCYSYANYEPSSRQFRIRAQAGNGIVFSSYADLDAVASGTYVVQPRDLPLYLVSPCGSSSEDFCSRPLQAGETTGKP